MIVLSECLRSCVFSLFCFWLQLLQGRIVCFEREICSCVKPSQAVQITTLNAVASHMRVFFPPLLLTCEVVPWLLDQVESEMCWKSSLVGWLGCTRATCDSGHLMHAIMTEVSVEPRVLVLAELALYLLYSICSVFPLKLGLVSRTLVFLYILYICVYLREDRPIQCSLGKPHESVCVFVTLGQIKNSPVSRDMNCEFL